MTRGKIMSFWLVKYILQTQQDQIDQSKRSQLEWENYKLKEEIKRIKSNNQPERSKREDFYGMKAEIDQNNILTTEGGKKYDLNQFIGDAVL
jgi:hypothetical protein